MIDLSKIKKLPDNERAKIIDEILDSMEDNSEDDEPVNEQYKLEVEHILRERLTAYNKGEMKSYTWGEVEERLDKARQKLHNPKIVLSSALNPYVKYG